MARGDTYRTDSEYAECISSNTVVIDISGSTIQFQFDGHSTVDRRRIVVVIITALFTAPQHP